ncbi:MAG: hypothetical protein WCQ50_21405 [Spirochaetota bacterium]
MRTTALEVLAGNLAKLEKSLKWLDRSFGRCSTIGLKEDYTEEDFDDFENLTSRYARTTDLITNKILRSIDAVEFLEPGSAIDAANRAEKRGIIESVAALRDLRDLRNDIAHEYETDDLRSLFSSVLSATPLVLETAERIASYCTMHFGTSSSMNRTGWMGKETEGRNARVWQGRNRSGRP